MLHEEDEALIGRMVGANALTPSLLQEYTIRLTMFHRGGGQGPLGPIALVDLLRDMGMRPPQLESEKARVDPRSLERGAPVMVKDANTGEIHKATFESPIAGGNYGVKYEGSDYVYEVCGYQILPAEPPKDPSVKGDPPSVDWSTVEAKTKVIAQLYEDGAPVEAEFIRVSGENLKVRPLEEKKHYSVSPDMVAVA